MTALKKIHIQDPTDLTQIARVSNLGALITDVPEEARASFGAIHSTEMSPILQAMFTYGISSVEISQEANQSGSISNSNHMAEMHTGAAANSSAFIHTNAFANYRPGLGLLSRFTAKFSAGVANSTQEAGHGDESDGFFFGYNGTSFGILHRKSGSRKVITLTINTASTTAENITITLDGDSTGAAVTVTNSGNTTTTANEIAAHDYSNVGRGWRAKASGSDVVFESWDAAVHGGSYSISATTANGSFASNVTGVVPTETWVAQADWNGVDKFDGNGATGVTLNTQALNVYQISFGYLGTAPARFFIMDPSDGELHLVHTLQIPNSSTTPSLGNPSLGLRVGAENSSSTTNTSVSTASIASFVEGKVPLTGIRFGTDHTATIGSANETPVLSLRIPEHYNGHANRSRVKIMRVSLSCEHSKPVTFRIYSNQTLTDASFGSINNVTSCEVDTSATASTGGILISTLNLGKSDNIWVELVDDPLGGVLQNANTFTFTADAFSGNNAEVSIGVNLLETP